MRRHVIDLDADFDEVSDDSAEVVLPVLIGNLLVNIILFGHRVIYNICLFAASYLFIDCAEPPERLRMDLDELDDEHNWSNGIGEANILHSVGHTPRAPGTVTSTSLQESLVVGFNC